MSSKEIKMPVAAYCEFCSFLEEDNIEELIEFKNSADFYNSKHDCPRCDRMELILLQNAPEKCSHCAGMGIMILPNPKTTQQ